MKDVLNCKKVLLYPGTFNPPHLGHASVVKVALAKVDFYKDKDDIESKKYQELQVFVINTMQDHGFRLGIKREYFHFDYRPDEPRNYL